PDVVAKLGDLGTVLRKCRRRSNGHGQSEEGKTAEKRSRHVYPCSVSKRATGPEKILTSKCGYVKAVGKRASFTLMACCPKEAADGVVQKLLVGGIAPSAGSVSPEGRDWHQRDSRHKGRLVTGVTNREI